KGLIVRFDERRDIVWRRDPKAGNATRNFPPALLRKEVETCGLCHARRGEFSEDWAPGRWLSDTHLVSPLARGLYYADGQMEDEVYNYGSFKQSKMFAAGVTCGDCHEPHAAKLRAPGDGVSMQCHAAQQYAPARPPLPAMKARAPRSPARPATCRSAPIWWSTAGTITVSAYHVPTRRQGSPRRMLATTAIPTNRRNGRHPRSCLAPERTPNPPTNT